MAGLVPAIHVLMVCAKKTWMPGTRPGMTLDTLFYSPLQNAILSRFDLAG
jgi:hypothetical protein